MNHRRVDDLHPAENLARTLAAEIEQARHARAQRFEILKNDRRLVLRECLEHVDHLHDDIELLSGKPEPLELGLAPDLPAGRS